MSELWTMEEFLAATNGRPVGDLPNGVTGISIDSRSLSGGEAFFAIRGDRFDGHDFIGSAEKAGAAIAVVDEEKLVALGRWNIPLIVVRDVLEAMVLLGRAARKRTSAQVLAITGSAGKTSTKEMMRTVFSASGRVHASAASFNNHWGVPLTLARMPRDTEFGIFEIGMNHPGEITPLVDMVRPHVAVITNVSAAHIGAFSNEEEIAQAKAEIFSGIVPGGYAVINRDSKHFGLLEKLAHKAGVEHLHTFGQHKGSDFKIDDLVSSSFGSEFTVWLGGEKGSVKLNVPGEHMVSNGAAVLGCALLVNADIKRSIEALGEVQVGAGRGAQSQLKVDGGTFTLIDESFNANPASMRAGLELLHNSKPGEHGRRIAVLGDMLEMGASSKKLHRDLAKLFKEYPADLVFLVGPEMAYLRDSLPDEMVGGYFESATDMESELFSALKAGDVLMAKASKGIKFAPLVQKMIENFGVAGSE